MLLKTISELEEYLELKRYSFTELSIGKHYAPEGIVIEEVDGSFNFSSVERGHKSVIQSFTKESDLVKYALDILESNKWLTAHLVATTMDKDEIMVAENQLNKMHIEFCRNDIPNYKMGCTRYRIFVFGIDIDCLSEFKERFLSY